MSLTLGLGALIWGLVKGMLVVGAIAVVVVALLKYQDIVDWFRGYEKLKLDDKNNIAFTLQERLDNGKYRVVQGIFNQASSTLPAARVLEANSIEPTLDDIHREGDGMAVYT